MDILSASARNPLVTNCDETSAIDPYLRSPLDRSFGVLIVDFESFSDFIAEDIDSLGQLPWRAVIGFGTQGSRMADVLLASYRQSQLVELTIPTSEFVRDYCEKLVESPTCVWLAVADRCLWQHVIASLSYSLWAAWKGARIAPPCIIALAAQPHSSIIAFVERLLLCSCERFAVTLSVAPGVAADPSITRVAGSVRDLAAALHKRLYFSPNAFVRLGDTEHTVSQSLLFGLAAKGVHVWHSTTAPIADDAQIAAEALRFYRGGPVSLLNLIYGHAVVTSTMTSLLQQITALADSPVSLLRVESQPGVGASTAVAYVAYSLQSSWLVAVIDPAISRRDFATVREAVKSLIQNVWKPTNLPVLLVADGVHETDAYQLIELLESARCNGVVAHATPLCVIIVFLKFCSFFLFPFPSLFTPRQFRNFASDMY